MSMIREPDDRAVMATFYARHGFAVGPLRGKIPLASLVPNGHKSFSHDVDQVRQWWHQRPTANIGVRPPKGWAVLDIDPRNGGADTWARLNEGHQLPATIVTRTGSGGAHWWFRLPYAGQLRGTAGEGVDVKTSRGYLVMPPSIHPDTGAAYEFEMWVNPDEVPALPVWLRKHVYRAPRPPRRLSGPAPVVGAGLVQAVAAAVEGNRNQALHWAACRAADDGLDLDAELTAAALSAGLDEREIRATLASARNTVKEAA